MVMAGTVCFYQFHASCFLGINMEGKDFVDKDESISVMSKANLSGD